MGWLSAGAGASKGLNTVLSRLLLEEQMQQREKQASRQQTEVERSHGADEGLRGRQIDATVESNNLNREATAAYRSATEQAGQRDDMRSALSQIPGGTTVSSDTRDRALKLGAAVPERFNSMVPYGDSFMGPVDENGPQRGESVISLRNTPAEEAAADRANKPAAEKSKQLKDVVYNGKHVNANYDPDSGVITYQGQDITNEAKPYEAPDRTLVPVDGVYTKRALAEGKATPETAATRAMSEGAKMLLPHIKSIETQAEALDANGLFGPMMSRVRDLATKAGTVQALGSDDPAAQQRALSALGEAIGSDPTLANDRLAGKFAASLGLLMTGAGRVHGGARGGGSVQMLDHFRSLLSGSSTLPMFLGRMDALGDFMDTYAKGPGGGTPNEKPPANTPSTGDAYDEFIRTHYPGQR